MRAKRILRFGVIIAVLNVAHLAVAPPAEAGCDINAYLGTICFTAAPHCALGYVPADGARFRMEDNQALYNLIKNTYGGEGQKGSFAVPDLRGRAAIGPMAGPSIRPYRQGIVWGVNDIAVPYPQAVFQDDARINGKVARIETPERLVLTACIKFHGEYPPKN